MIIAEIKRSISVETQRYSFFVKDNNRETDVWGCNE